MEAHHRRLEAMRVNLETSRTSDQETADTQRLHPICETSDTSRVIEPGKGDIYELPPMRVPFHAMVSSKSEARTLKAHFAGAVDESSYGCAPSEIALSRNSGAEVSEGVVG